MQQSKNEMSVLVAVVINGFLNSVFHESNLGSAVYKSLSTKHHQCHCELYSVFRLALWVTFGDVVQSLSRVQLFETAAPSDIWYLKSDEGAFLEAEKEKYGSKLSKHHRISC